MALKKQGTQLQRPKSPTVTPPGMRVNIGYTDYTNSTSSTHKVITGYIDYTNGTSSTQKVNTGYVDYTNGTSSTQRVNTGYVDYTNGTSSIQKKNAPQKCMSGGLTGGDSGLYCCVPCLLSSIAP